MALQPARPRGQSALEYLVTYGWAILAIVIIGAALWYTGVFSPESFIGVKSASGFSGMLASDFSVDPLGKLTIILNNQLGNAISNISVAGGSCSPASVAAGGNTTCKASGALPSGAPGSTYQGAVRGWYVNARSGINHTLSGTIRGRYEGAWLPWVDSTAVLSLHLENNALDASPSGNNGNLNGPPTFVPSCKKGGCYSFAGPSSSQKIGLSTPLITGTGDFTATAWVNLVNPAVANFVMGNYGSGNAGGVELYVYNGIVNYYATAATSGGPVLSANQWYHVAWVRSSGTVTLYLNGAPVYSAGNANAITGSRNWYAGGGTDYNAENLNGQIDEAHVYARALSATEIAAMYNYENAG
ncbi:LamG domain-containing protein [Candidatus Micrarchaeota archaeon]|nr:LamG domain-containing protein [Candidatus Micrarchaeota archaeon]